MRESLQPPPIPAEFLYDDGISPVRLVTAIVLLALSLAIGYRSARDPAPPEPAPQPVPDRVVAAVELPPLGSVAVAAPLPPPDASPPRSLAPVKAAAHAEPPRARASRHQISHARNRALASHATRSRRHQVVAAAYEPAALRRSVRTRAQVRGEYLRTREVVAALTGEDSGSVYLTRVAARQRAARLEGAGRRRG